MSKELVVPILMYIRLSGKLNPLRLNFDAKEGLQINALLIILCRFGRFFCKVVYG